jgi:hypothetical protein
MGVAISPIINPLRSIAVVAAFFLGLGIGAHALDETMGNPLQTKLSKGRLYVIGLTALSAAIGIGLYYALTVSLLLVPFIVAESFFAVAYNLEMFGKRFHTTLVFSLSWGSIPLLTGYFANSLSISVAAFVMAVAAGLLTLVQRTLSTQARFVRRKVTTVDALRLSSGGYVPVSSGELISPAEKSLKALSLVVFLIALALVLERFVS